MILVTQFEVSISCLMVELNINLQQLIVLCVAF